MKKENTNWLLIAAGVAFPIVGHALGLFKIELNLVMLAWLAYMVWLAQRVAE